jgi:tetratricopeptide (TPR) repeat protein
LAVWHAAVKQEQGRQADAIQLCYRAIEEAELAGDMDALAHSYYILDWALADLGRLEEAVHSQRALEIYRELGDVSSQAAVLQNLGGFAYFKGDWDEAVRLYERGREARERTGDPVNAAAGTFNIGEILSDQGHLTEAERSLREALRIWKAAGDQIGVAFAVSFLGRVASRGGLFDQAAELLREARSRFQEAGAMRELVEVDAYAAELLVFRGMWHEALEAADVALKRSNPGIGVGAQDPLLHRVRGFALIQGGDLVAGRAALERSLSSARSRGAPYEAALTQRAQDRPDLPSDSDGGPGEASSSLSILRGLGVVAVFDPALTPAPGQAVDLSPEAAVT